MILKNNQLLLFGKKVENTYSFINDKYVPVTKVSIYDLFVTDIRKSSVCIAYDQTKKFKKPQSSELGNFKKFTEIHLEGNIDIENNCIKVDYDKLINCSVNVTGVSKGKGFQGVVKRHGFKKGPRSHGSSKFHRRPGSIASGETFPARVLPGTKMPGNMGNDKVTIKNLKILNTDKYNSILFIKGLIPGSIKKDVKILVNNV